VITIGAGAVEAFGIALFSTNVITVIAAKEFGSE
jgi:hypothetical protein